MENFVFFCHNSLNIKISTKTTLFWNHIENIAFPKYQHFEKNYDNFEKYFFVHIFENINIWVSWLFIYFFFWPIYPKILTFPKVSKCKVKVVFFRSLSENSFSPHHQIFEENLVILRSLYRICFILSSLSKSRFCPYIRKYLYVEENEKIVFCPYLRKYQN